MLTPAAHACSLLLALLALARACPPGTTPNAALCIATAPLTISSPQTWAGGAYIFGDLTISSTIYISGTVNLTAKSLFLTSTGSIVGDGGGFGSEAGPCWEPPSGPYYYIGTGAAHGGCPSHSCPGPLYSIVGDALAPTLPGSGGRAGLHKPGNCPRGGAGGAALLLTADTLQFSGVISMNGAAGTQGNVAQCHEGGGGGAGGSVLVRAGVLLSSRGSIRANGGNGPLTLQGAIGSAPGGGGRIALYCSSAQDSFLPAALDSWPLALRAMGGTWAGSFPGPTAESNGGWPGGSMGGAGTIFADCGLTRAALLLAGDPAVFRSPMANSTLLLAGGGAVALSSVAFASSGSLVVAVPPGAPPASLCIDALLNSSAGLAQRVVAGANVSLQVGGCVCAPGTFSLTGGALPCLAACPPGFSCAGNVATPCAAGTASAPGSAGCAACAAGTFAAARSPACTPCPAGFYGSATGLTFSSCSGACSAAPGSGCPAGSTSASPARCAAGFFCPGGTPAPALPCPPSSFSAAPGAAACTQCPIGAYCAGGGTAAVPCSPATACTVPGLAAQPPCFWNVSTLAGSGARASTNGAGTLAAFKGPTGLCSVNDVVYVAEYIGHFIRAISPSGLTSTLAGSGAPFFANGIGAAAAFDLPHDVTYHPALGDSLHCGQK